MMKMLRNIFILLLPFIVIFAIWKYTPQKLYNAGLSCYNMQDYKCAVEEIGKALRYDNGNTDFRYYYTKSLTEAEPNYYNEKILFEIANDGKNDSASTVAQNKLFDIRNNILKKYPDNYIEQVPSTHDILRWSHNSFPLPVYLENFDSVPPYYKDAVIESMNIWQRAIDFISFKLTSNKDDAKIIITVTPQEVECSEGCKYATGKTTPYMKFNKLTLMRVIIYDKDVNGEYRKQENLITTITHELGHALGIQGHSYSNNDIMFPTEQNKDIYSQYKSNMHKLSTSDRNTIKLLYSMSANIIDEDDTNESLTYAPVLIGNRKKTIERKIKEYEQYLKENPHLGTAYMNLAGAYLENNEYNKAKKYMKEGLQHTTSAEEKYQILYNLAVLYYKTDKPQAAIEYLNKAAQINNTDEIKNFLEIINSANQ